MSHWVVTANGTVSGPFPKAKADAEKARLIHLSRGRRASNIKVVQANSADEARAQKPL